MTCSRLEDSTFFGLLKMGHGHDLLFTLPWETAETSQKTDEDFFFIRRTPDFSRKFGVFSCEDLFWRSPGKNVWGLFFLENNCALVPGLGLEHSCPWPRIFFCALGLEDCVLDSACVNYLPRYLVFSLKKLIVSWL